MPRCHLALGGNLGDVEGAFHVALSRMASTPGVNVVCVSPIYRTRPVGQNTGGEFLNAAAAIDTARDPLALLDLLQQLETEAGRTHAPTWGPRPLDLDIIFYADQIIDSPRLCVPHPASWYRRFVLDPLSVIAPDVRHPTKRITVADLRSRISKRPLPWAMAGGSPARRRQLADILSPQFPEAALVRLPASKERAPDEPAILAWLGPTASSDGAPSEFEALPVIPRLDASAAVDQAAFLHDVLSSALG